MANTLEYIERAARKVDPDSPEFHELSRQYQVELNRLWTDPNPLPWRDVLDHDSKRTYPQSFLPFSVPTAGTNEWQKQAKRFGVDSDQRDTAKARLALYRLGETPIKHRRTEYSVDSLYFLAIRPFKTGRVDKFGHDYDADRYLDALIDRVREIHRLAVSTGFLVPPVDAVEKEAA